MSGLALDQDIELPGQPTDVQRVGKYRIISELGRGGAASVYLAFARGQNQVNKLVVLKALHPEGAADTETQLRFLDEARIAAQLNHANVVQTFEVGIEGDRNVIVMEYLEGHTLNQVMRRAKQQGEAFPLAMQLNVVIHALEGLHYAHEFRSYDGTPLNIVHRDVSPQNIFLTYDGQIKVLDFGIAKIVGASAKTQVGTIKGKIAYMAPEQMRAEDIDRRADIFSVGCMLWSLASGTKLWKDTSDVQIIRAVVRGEIPRVGEHKPDADPAFVQIIEKAMAFDPGDRYATALELQADLQHYCEARRLVATQKELGRYVSKAFSGIRSEMKAQVEREISRIMAENSSNVFATVGDIAHPSMLSAARPIAEPPRSGSFSKYLIGGALVALGAAAGAYFMARPAPQSAPSPDLAVAPTAKVETATPTPGTPDKATVLINFRVSPPGATLTVDGRTLPPGTTSQTLPNDDAVHVLKVESVGLAPIVREFSASRDDTVEVHLAPRGALPSPAPQGRAPARVAPPSPKPTAVHVAPAPAPKPSDAPAKPDCDSPSYFDSNGIKRFRAECL